MLTHGLASVVSVAKIRIASRLIPRSWKDHGHNKQCSGTDRKIEPAGSDLGGVPGVSSPYLSGNKCGGKHKLYFFFNPTKKGVLVVILNKTTPLYEPLLVSHADQREIPLPALWPLRRALSFPLRTTPAAGASLALSLHRASLFSIASYSGCSSLLALLPHRRASLFYIAN